MKNMKLGVKLIGGFGVAVLLMAILIMINVVQLTQLKQLQDAGASRAADSIVAMEGAGMGPRLYQIVADAIINRNLAEARKEWTKIQTEAVADLSVLEKLADTTEEKKWIAGAKAAHTAFTQIAENELFPMLDKSAEITDGIRTADGKMDDQTGKMVEALTALSKT